MAREAEIQSYWQRNPVGENLVGHLSNDFMGEERAFFDAYDAWYYGGQGHILRMLDLFPWRDKRVLEIGLGQSADAEQLVRRGAPLVRHRSHVGVGRPGKKAFMVYTRRSLNYARAIRWIRRVGLLAIYFLPIKLSALLERHRKNARAVGLINYLRMETFIHRSTDGPDNPYSKVYDLGTIKQDFSNFEVLRTFKRYMHAPPLPMHGLPGESPLGWHLSAELSPPAVGCPPASNMRVQNTSRLAQAKN